METGDPRGEKHGKVLPALPQGRSGPAPNQVKTSTLLQERVATAQGHGRCGALEETLERERSSQAEGAQLPHVGGGAVLPAGQKASRGPHYDSSFPDGGHRELLAENTVRDRGALRHPPPRLWPTAQGLS